MRVAITGATGFIGSALTNALQARGDTVIVLSRDPERASNTLPGVEAAPWNSNNRSLPDAHAVIHLAGESVSGRWSPEKKKAIRASREEGTRQLVDAILRRTDKPSVLVSASATGYYGNRGDEELTEDSAPGQGFLPEVARIWESESQRAREAGIRVVNPRIGVVLGPDGGALAPMMLPYKLGLGGPMGSGRQWFSWVQLADVVGLFLHALDQDIFGPMNATAPQPVRQKEFARALGQALGRPAVLPAPAFAVRALLGEFAGELLGGQKVLPRKALDTGYVFRYPELAAALRSSLTTSGT